MLKLTGLLLLFSSCTLFGTYRALQLGERAKAVGRMIDFWRQFALQLEALRASPAQLVHMLAAEQEFAGDRFFSLLDNSFDSGSFKQALCSAVSAVPQLKSWGIAQAILPLGDIIGVRELETQLAEIASVILRLTKIQDIAETEREQKGGLYQRLGVMAGILCVVIFF